MAERKLITTAELAEWIGVSRNTLFRYIRYGAIVPTINEKGVRGFLFAWPDLEPEAERLRTYIKRGGSAPAYVELLQKGFDPITLEELPDDKKPAPKAE